MNVYDFGWSDKITDEKTDSQNIARITAVRKGVFDAISDQGEINIYIPGSFHGDSNSRLVTGDFVLISPRFNDEQNKPAAMVEKIFPRWSKLSRIAPGDRAKEQILATNLDYVMIVTSANEDFNINRLQRYLLLAKQGGVTPIIILSKIDLITDSEKFISEIKDRIGQVTVFPISSVEQQGIDPIVEILKPGTTSAFVGSSGVGKSTLVNYLLGENVQKTATIRKDDGKGRHGTTTRELFFLPNGSMVIDTPGLREVQVFAAEDNLTETFENITDLIKNCKFSDCTHGNEPGCAINAAIKAGNLNEQEYGNFLKLEKEARYNEKKMNKTTSTNDKRRWKEINQNTRARRKFDEKN